MSTPKLHWRPVAAVLGIVVLVEIAIAAASGPLGYGFHRDELYFMVAGRRLAWGFVDQPPLTPALVRATQVVLGDGLVAFRVVPALMGGAIVALAAATARELGGGRRAQVLAAVAVGTSTFFAVVRHLFSTTSVDMVVWAIAVWLLARWLRTGQDRLLLVVGGVAGIGLLNKHLVLFLGLGLVVSLVIARRWGALRSPWLWAGGAAAFVLWSPNLLWQVRNDWPTLEMISALSERHGGDRAVLLPAHLLQLNPFLVPLLVLGLVWLLRRPETARFRALGWLWPVTVAAVLVTGGQPYYPAGAALALFAAGAVALEKRWWSRDGGTSPQRFGPVVGAIVAAGLVPLPAILPLLPASDVPVLPEDVNYDLLETIGWPDLAEQVGAVYANLPAGDRDRVAILTRNYGEAGALERYRERAGLPGDLPVMSGHNAYGAWGPEGAGDDDVVIVVGYAEEGLQSLFADVDLAATITNDAGVPNEELGTPVWVARGLRGTWQEVWPDIAAVG